MRVQYFSIVLLIGIVVGCSGGINNSAVTTMSGQSLSAIQPKSNHYMWGLWQFVADPHNETLEVVPLRTSALHVNVVPFLEPPPGLRLSIANVTFDGLVCDVDVSLTHPFAGLDQYTGFDVNGIMISHGSVGGFSDPGLVMAGEGETRILNPDGYSRWWNPIEFPQNGSIFAYKDGMLGNKHSSVNFTATLNGYKLFGDGIQANDDVLSIDPESRIHFTAGTKNTRHYTIDFAGGVVFNYAVDANWEPPMSGPPYPLEVFPENANRPEAWAISVSEAENTLYNNGGGEKGGNLILDVFVYDHFNAGMNTVKLESPGNFDPVSSNTIIGSGIGYSVYQIEVLSATPSVDSIDILIGVESEDAEYGGLLSGTMTTAYFMYSAEVGTSLPSIKVTSPNGGEVWQGITPHDITWTSPGTVTNVDISYSKDNFVSENIPIVSNYANTGTYQWNVANDPSTTVKVRVKESGGTLKDESDNYFEITPGDCQFGTTGHSLANNWAMSGVYTYFGIVATKQDPIQRIISIDASPYHILKVFSASNPLSGPVATYDTGDLIYCNNSQALWIDSTSEPGIDRIIYNNFGSGSPTAGYQLKKIDWNGSAFVDPVTLPKSGSIWNLCVTHEGDIILHNAQSVSPSFYFYDKSNGYNYSLLFTLTSSTCNFGTVANIRSIRYVPDQDAIAILCTNTSVSAGGQIYLLSKSGALMYQDTDVFESTSNMDSNSHIAVDLSESGCRIVVYGETVNGTTHTGYIVRYSSDLGVKKIYQYSGMSYGPGRGELGANGKLYTGPANGLARFYEWNPPTDW